MNDPVQHVNDQMWGVEGEQTEADKERELQWLLKNWTDWENRRDSHDCTLSPDSGCEVCEGYENFINTYIK